MTQPKCECPSNSMNNPNLIEEYTEEERIGMKHKPNKCKCTTNLRRYIRYSDKKIRWLCSCCNIYLDDIEIKE